MGSEFSKALGVSISGLKAQATRLRHLSENISNADTPGYRRKTISFEAEVARDDKASQVKAGRVQLDRTDLKRVYDPSHPLADASGHYEGSNVNLLMDQIKLLAKFTSSLHSINHIVSGLFAIAGSSRSLLIGHCPQQEKRKKVASVFPRQMQKKKGSEKKRKASKRCGSAEANRAQAKL